MYDQDDLLPLSALQHWMFCPRQCALIHLEGIWRENRFTVEGRHLHERAHESGGESRGDLRVARGVLLRSLRLGLSGKADVLEFHRPGPDDGEGGSAASGSACWQPFPVDYKRGRPKRNECDEVQLCAQALCIEEMLGVEAPAGALFYGRTRRRWKVFFTADLRRRTEQCARDVHAMVEARATPPAERGPKCRHCSLADVCLPRLSERRSANRIFWQGISSMMQTEGRQQ